MGLYVEEGRFNEGSLSTIGHRRRWQRDYLSEVMDYVHLNPARANVAGPASIDRPSVADYPWSSLAMGYSLPPKKRPRHLHGDTFTHFGLDDTTTGRRAFVRRLDEIAAAEAEIELAPDEPSPMERFSELFERGWVHGSDIFREMVLESFASMGKNGIVTATNSNYRSSELGKAFTAAEAERILTEGLKHFGLEELSLRKTPKGDWRKVAIAWAICERTTARQDWIADRLHLKSASNVSQRVRQYREKDEKTKPKKERSWERRWKNSKF